MNSADHDPPDLPAESAPYGEPIPADEVVPPPAEAAAAKPPADAAAADLIPAVDPPSDTEPLPATPQVVVSAPTHPTRPLGPVAVPVPVRPVPKAGPRIDLHVQFPNATVGKPYRADINLVPRGPGLPAATRAGDLSVTCTRVDGLAESGLTAETPDGMIVVSGMPGRAGDYAVAVSFEVKHQGHPFAAGQKQLTLTVNPDPRSLWKDLEPDGALPYRKPHTACERVAGAVVLVAASRRGRSHAHEAKFRDDEFRLGPAAVGGWHYFAVADGAGSAKFSRRGSEIACQVTCEGIVPHLTGTLGPAFERHAAEYARTGGEAASRQVRNALYKSLGGVGHAAYKSIEREAKEHNGPAKDFATTLIFTLCRRFDFGWLVAAFAIGDGGVAVYRREGGTVALSRADSGEFAGQTRFLTMPEVWANGEDILGRIHFEVVPDLTAVVAMTDGVSDAMFPTDRDFLDHAAWGRFWGGLAKDVNLSRDNAAADAELLEWLNFWSTGNHDDRTIAMLIP